MTFHVIQPTCTLFYSFAHVKYFDCLNSLNRATKIECVKMYRMIAGQRLKYVSDPKIDPVSALQGTLSLTFCSQVQVIGAAYYAEPSNMKWVSDLLPIDKFINDSATKYRVQLFGILNSKLVIATITPTQKRARINLVVLFHN